MHAKKIGHQRSQTFFRGPSIDRGIMIRAI
jgi:hypothetical protein